MFSMAIRTAQVDSIREMLENGTKIAYLDEPVCQFSCAKQCIASATCNDDILREYVLCHIGQILICHAIVQYRLAMNRAKHTSRLWTVQTVAFTLNAATKYWYCSACLMREFAVYRVPWCCHLLLAKHKKPKMHCTTPQITTLLMQMLR